MQTSMLLSCSWLETLSWTIVVGLRFLIFFKRWHSFHVCLTVFFLDFLQNFCSTGIIIFVEFFIFCSPYFFKYKAQKYNLCLMNYSWTFSLHHDAKQLVTSDSTRQESSKPYHIAQANGMRQILSINIFFLPNFKGI